jgi:DNA replication protein DnaC
MVISSNLSLEQLRDRYSERIFSRITSNFELLRLSGGDIRMKRKLESVRKEGL